MHIQKNVSIRFHCGASTEEKVVVDDFDCPAYYEACFLHRHDVMKGGNYTMQLKVSGKVVAEKSGTLPMDWSNPLDWAVTLYSKGDKGLKHVPWIGRFLERLAPDVKWQFDLWYQFVIDESGRLDYKLHFGPSSTIDFRDKLEGSVSLT